MLTKRYVIEDALGLHARPAGVLMKEAQKYQSEITLTNKKNGKSASAKGLFALLGLEVTQGDAVELCARGADEEAAMRGVGAVIEEQLAGEAEALS